MKLKYFVVLTAFTLCHPPLIQANELSQVEWQLSQDNLDNILLLSSNNGQYKEMVQLLREIRFDVKKDKVIEQRTLVNYFPRFVDAESYGTMTLRFDPNYQKVIIKTASSISPAGEIEQIKPYQAQILNTDSYNTFSSQKEVALAIPGLEEGSIAVLKYEIVTKRSQTEHSWAEELFTQQNYPIKKYNLNVTWNEDSPIYWSENSHEIECKKIDKNLECQGNDISEFEDDSQVLWRDEISRITLSSLNSWQDVADLATKTMAAASKDQSGLDELFLALTAGTQNTSEKIERILTFVSRDIRYVSHSEYGHAITPHDIAETIRNRFGDCKDKSTLLLSLFKKLSLNPELVLVATQRSRSEQILKPSMTVFNHVIVCFEFDGARYCVDPTDNQIHWRYTPAWIQGKISLPLTQDSQLEKIQTNPYRWKMNTTTQTVFDELGGQKEKQTRTYIGEYAAVIRANLFELSSKDRVTELTDEYHKIVSSIGDPKFYIENIGLMTGSATVHSDTIISPFLKLGEPLSYEESDAWLENELSYLKMFNKLYPAFFPGVSVTSTIDYDTNGLWEITDLPPTLELKHPLGSLTRQVNLTSPTKLSVETVLKVKSGIVKQEDRQHFNNMLKIYSEQSLIKFYGKVIKPAKQVDKS